MIDVVMERKGGRRERVRRVAPFQSKRAAEQYEREVRQSLLDGSDDEKKEVVEIPTFASFAKQFMATYAKTNNKPNEQQSKEAILRVHLEPEFGKLRLDAIGQEQVERYKAKKLGATLAPKTINNHLTVLRRMLAVAVEWGKLKTVPPVRCLRAPAPDFDFLTFEEARRLVAASAAAWRPMIVLGLRCGLRQGELLALRWDDVDLVAGRLVVRRAVSRGVIGTPKGGRARGDSSLGRCRPCASRAASPQGRTGLRRREGRSAHEGRVQVAALARVPTRRTSPRRLACTPALVRLASRDARSTAQGRAGAARARVDRDDHALRASQPRRTARRRASARRSRHIRGT
jgi:hypothetical protein